MAKESKTYLSPPDPAFVAWVKEQEERALSPEEFMARANEPLSDFEREDLEAHYLNFVRKNPTAGERLAAVRRLTEQWLRNKPR